MGGNYYVSQKNQAKQKLERDVIEEVRKYPCLYSRDHTDFRNDVKMELCWIQIAKDLKVSVKDCKRTWRRVKGQGQEQKKRLYRLSMSGGPVIRPTYRHEEALEFCLKDVYPDPSPDCQWIVKERPYEGKPPGRKKRKASKKKDQDLDSDSDSSSAAVQSEDLPVADADEVEILDENGEPEGMSTRSRKRSNRPASVKARMWMDLVIKDQGADRVSTPMGKKWEWDEKLIKCIRDKPIIYDITLEDWSKNDVPSAWDEVAEDLGTQDKPISVEVCKARWKTLRDQYRAYLIKTKKYNTEGGGATKPVSFSHAESMEFLKDFIHRKNDPEEIPGAKASLQRRKERIMYSKLCNAAVGTLSTEATPTSAQHQKLDSAIFGEANNDDEACFNDADHYDDSHEVMETENVATTHNESHHYESYTTASAVPVTDDIDHFLCSLAPALRRIHTQNPRKCAELKIKFLQILTEAEYLD